MISTAELAPLVGKAKLDELMELDALTTHAKEQYEAVAAEHKTALAALDAARLQAEQGNVIERTLARQKLAGLTEVAEACAAAQRAAQAEYQRASWKSGTLRDSLVNAHRRLQALDSERELPPVHRERARAKLQGVLGVA